MARRWVRIAVFVGALVLLAGGAYYLTNVRGAPRDIPTALPSSAPAVGSCWRVAPEIARAAFPWDAVVVDCTAAHSMEIVHVGQVDVALIQQLDSGDEQSRRVAENLMYGQARRSCLNAASAYVGGGWHAGRLSVVANWIEPTENGFYGCALAEVADPAGAEVVLRHATLRDSLKEGYAAPIAISCVARPDASAPLRYAGCDQPHDGEYTGLYTVTPIDAPFDESGVRAAATRGCTGVGLSYLGLATGATRDDLRAAYVGPASAQDWLGSDQTYACYLMVNEGKVRGSVKGLGTAPLPR